VGKVGVFIRCTIQEERCWNLGIEERNTQGREAWRDEMSLPAVSMPVAYVGRPETPAGLCPPGDSNAQWPDENGL
jgi:hypothetical protein